MGQVVNSFRKATIFKMACMGAAAGNAVADFVGAVETDDDTGRHNVFVYTCSVETALAQATTADVGDTGLDVSFADTTAGNAVVAFATTGSTTFDITAGVIEDSSAVAIVGRLHKSASANGIPGGALTLTASAHAVAIAAELETM